ncbi:TetR/AcrR family transcriptional regulator [Antricoccus suffuscus]
MKEPTARATVAYGRLPPATCSLERSDDRPNVGKILEAAIVVIARFGYHGTSIRDIAKAAEISPGTIYNHFESKHELLVAIISRGRASLLEATEQALFETPKHPAAQFRAIVGDHVRRHATYPLESLIGNSELWSLDRTSRRLVVSLRDGQQRMFERVVSDGISQGSFPIDGPIEAANHRAVSASCFGPRRIQGAGSRLGSTRPQGASR